MAQSYNEALIQQAVEIRGIVSDVELAAIIEQAMMKDYFKDLYK